MHLNQPPLIVLIGKKHSIFTDLESTLRILLIGEKLLISTAVGYLIVGINFPSLIELFTDAFIKYELLKIVIEFPKNILAHFLSYLTAKEGIKIFKNLMLTNFILFWVYYFSIIVSSIRYQMPHLIFTNLLGLFLGYWAIHLLTWISLLIVYLGALFFGILKIISGFLGDYYMGIIVFLLLTGITIFFLNTKYNLCYIKRQKRTV